MIGFTLGEIMGVVPVEDGEEPVDLKDHPMERPVVHIMQWPVFHIISPADPGRVLEKIAARTMADAMAHVRRIFGHDDVVVMPSSEMASAGNVDYAKLDATTEEDIERHAVEDGEVPDADAPTPAAKEE